MPTLTELASEACWRNEVVTPELDWLVDNLCDFYGVPRGNGGTRGDRYHLNGSHRSQMWIVTSRYCTNRTYTVVRWLSPVNADDISGFDVSLPPAKMLEISRNADRATRSGQLEELVEWYGNIDGDQVVDGWNNIENRIARSDSSHLWHLHGGIDRRYTRDMAVMRKIFTALTTGKVSTPGGSDMEVITIARAGDGQLYACNGMRSRPITAASIPHLRQLAKEGRLGLAGNGEVREGWSEEIYGSLDQTPGDTIVNVEVDRIADAVLAKLLEKLQS